MPRRLSLPVRILWYVLLVVAVLSQVGGIWRGVVQATVIDQRYAAVGLATSYPHHDSRFLVNPATEAIAKKGVPADARVIAIEGRAVPADISEEALAKRLAGPDGTITLRIAGPDGKTRDYRLERSERMRADVTEAPVGPLTYSLILAAFGLVSAVTLLIAAILLARRRPDDPVALMLSLSFLAGISSLERATGFFEWLGADWANDVLPAIWIGLLVAVLPAFPDGRFVPRWGGWVALAAIPFTVVIMPAESPEILVLPLVLIVGLPAVAAPFVRFRRTPPGVERQQLKWAASGFAASMAMLIAVLVFMELFEAGLIPEIPVAWLGIAVLGVFNLVFVSLALGVLVAMLRFRLWDADAAIGRSISYAAITLLLASVWAASSEAVQQLLEGELGDGGAPIAASIATVVAVMIFGPANDRINAWVGKRFQPGLLRLRALPSKLQVWQHEDEPEEVGHRVVDAIVECLRAQRAAIVLHSDGSYLTLAADSIDIEEVARWVASHIGGDALTIDNIDRRDPLFPVRLLLEDMGRPIGALLLGPRTDGSIYAKEERGALDALEPPLAAALRQSQRQRRQEARLAALIARLESRLEQLEFGPPAPARPSSG